MGLFNEIYDLTYLPLVTPNTLLNTLKVENFISINYSKDKKNNINAEVICEVDNKIMTFFYIFDKRDYLLEIYFLENDKKEYLFNRNEALKESKEQYLNSKNDMLKIAK